MDGINQKYNVALEVLSPLSIGAGTEKDWVEGVDFVVKDHLLYKLNLKKMINNGIDMLILSSYFAEKDSTGIIKLIGDRLDDVSDFCMPCPYATENDIKTITKNQLSGKPIIPGSSIKGAFRSILFEYLRGKGSSIDEREVFGSPKTGDEFMRFIKFSDIEFSETQLVNTKIFNLKPSGNGWDGGWKHGRNNTSYTFSEEGFNTIYEAMAVHEVSVGYMMLSETAFSLFGEDKQSSGTRKKALLSADKLFSVINNHTRRHLIKEKSFFENYSTDKSDRILSSIEYLLSAIPNDNSACVFKMSAGSGFHSITGDWQFENYSIDGIRIHKNISRGLFNDKPSSKSRKIAVVGDFFTPMGFVKLSMVSQKEKDDIQAKNEQRNREKEKHLERVRLQKEEAKADEIRHATLYAEYMMIIKTADSLYEQQSYKEALAEYNKAYSLLPEESSHKNRITEINNILDRIDRENQSSALEAQGDLLFQNQQYQDAKSKYEEVNALGVKLIFDKIHKCEEFMQMGSGSIEEFVIVSSISACAGKLKKWNSLHVITDSDCKYIATKLGLEMSSLNSSKKKDWKEWKKWKPLIDLLGDAQARTIYDSVFNS